VDAADGTHETETAMTRVVGSFGTALRTRRISAQLSRLKLGQLAGLSEATIKFLETGRIDKPSMRTLLKLLRTSELGLTLSELPEPLARSVMPYLRLDSSQTESKDAGVDTISLRAAAIGASIGTIERVLVKMESHPTTNLRDWLSIELVFLRGRRDALFGPDSFGGEDQSLPPLTLPNHSGAVPAASR
jgi:transcriptional regulator with XRE-family HTH domain